MREAIPLTIDMTKALSNLPFVQYNFSNRQKMAYKNMHIVYQRFHQGSALVEILQDHPSAGDRDEGNILEIHIESPLKGNNFDLRFVHFHLE